MLFATPLLTIYSLTLLGILGAVCASFLGCFAWRICHGERVTAGRSHCDACGHVLGVRDLVPICSYLSTKGHCRYCGAKISSISFYGEVILAALFIGAALRFDLTAELLLALSFFCLLYVITLTDLYEQIILDRCILLGIVLRIGYFFCVEEVSLGAFLGLLGNGLVIAVPILLLTLVMEWILKKEALGGGDIKLLFVLGMYLGWANCLVMLLLACVTGIIYVLHMERQTEAKIASEAKEQMQEETAETTYPAIPFGPFLAAGAAVTCFCGDWILDWYTALFF